MSGNDKRELSARSMKAQTNLNPPSIRPLRALDIELLGDLYFPWSTKQETVEKWKRYLEEQQVGTRIARIIEYEDKIVGYGNLLLYSEYASFKIDNVPEINDVWIDDHYRRKGLGTLLLSHLEQSAKQLGYPQIGIGVGLYRDYGPAQRLYFRLGYKPDGRGISYKHTPVTPGEAYPIDDDLILWLTKHLS